MTTRCAVCNTTHLDIVGCPRPSARGAVGALIAAVQEAIDAGTHLDNWALSETDELKRALPRAAQEHAAMVAFIRGLLEDDRIGGDYERDARSLLARIDKEPS